MRVASYGLFWRASEIKWEPGSGNKQSFRLLGRIGKAANNLRLADFRQQRGIYILYNDYGPYYVGLTRDLGLGARLKSHHLHNDRAGKWDRFSWFGFKDLASVKDKNGVYALEEGLDEVVSSMATTIGDLEALLIAAMGTKSNGRGEKFSEAERWEQVMEEEVDKYERRAKSTFLLDE